MIQKMFSKTGILLVACLTISAVNAQKSFLIKGALGKEKQGKVRITFKDGDKYVTDSTQVKDGTFALKGTIGDPAQAEIVLNPSNPNAWRSTMESMKDDRLSFYLEAGTTNIIGNGNLKTAIATGGKAQKDYAYVMSLYEPLNIESSRLNDLGTKYRKEQNDTALAKLKDLSKVLKQKKEAGDSTFVANNPDSYMAFLISFKKELKGKTLDFKIDESKFNHFTKEVRNTNLGKTIAARLAVAKNIDLGATAPDFTLNDTIGNPVKLSSLRGKYVLVWFWHSMIMGSEGQYFNVSKAYKKIDSSKFVVLGVSYERQAQMYEGDIYEAEVKNSWKKLIRDNNMKWLSVIDYGGINIKTGEPVSATAKAYDLNYANIPQCVLVNPNGKIVLKAPADNDLVPKLKKIIGE